MCFFRLTVMLYFLGFLLYFLASILLYFMYKKNTQHYYVTKRIFFPYYSPINVHICNAFLILTVYNVSELKRIFWLWNERMWAESTLFITHNKFFFWCNKINCLWHLLNHSYMCGYCMSLIKKFFYGLKLKINEMFSLEKEAEKIKLQQKNLFNNKIINVNWAAE